MIQYDIIYHNVSKINYLFIYLLVFFFQDVVSKIFSFFEEAPRAVFILSATGEVASVRIGITSVAFTQYEAWFSLTESFLFFNFTFTCFFVHMSFLSFLQALFEILTLDGSFMFGESGSNSKKTMFTISLAMPNGNVFGGRVVSPLLAAGPIQVSFFSSFLKIYSRAYLFFSF